MPKFQHLSRSDTVRIACTVVLFGLGFILVSKTTASLHLVDPGRILASPKFSLRGAPQRISGDSSARNPEATGFTTRTLDTGTNGPTGSYTSQAVVNGNPAISYYNSSDTNLMFARNSAADGSGTWTIITVDNMGSVGQSTSLVVIDGNPAISYFDSVNNDVKYVRATDANGTNWGTPVTVDGADNASGDVSLAIINGHPAISYADGSNNGRVRYVWAADSTGTSWGTPVTASNFRGYLESLALINGRPAIAFLDGVANNLKYVRAADESGTSWGASVTLDNSGNSGYYPSLAVINGNPAISYAKVPFGGLRYLRASDVNGTAWNAPVTAATSGGTYSSLAVVNGNPAISYWDSTTRALRYVSASDASGTTWSTPVTCDTNAGQYTSLRVVGSFPAISYFDNTNGDLKYVRAADASGTSWTPGVNIDNNPQSGNVGRFTSQAVVNGNPAVSYYDDANGALKYLRANDPYGSSWGMPVTVDSIGHTDAYRGSYMSLVVVNGNPAISYFDITDQDLRYVRATDADGTSWGTPLTLDAVGVIGEYPSLAIADGNPAISYFDRTNATIKYVRATEPSGTAWGTPATVTSAGTTDPYPSLAVMAGNPAISFFAGGTDPDVKFVRSSDTGGSSWGTPATVVSHTGSSGSFTSMVVVNGNPAISFVGSSEYVGFARNSAPDGSGIWTNSVVESLGDVGWYLSLAVVNGNPAISYWDRTTTGILKYVRADNPNGTSWPGPMIVDSTGQVGQYTSLAVVNGKPAISYYDVTNTDLKWATELTGPTPTASFTFSPTSTSTNTPAATATTTATPTSTFTPTPANTPSISGAVLYRGDVFPTKYISNVLVTGTGSPIVTTTTAPLGGTAGQYTLTGFGAGNYAVSLAKTTGQNSVTSNDAAQIAQHVAGTVAIATDPKKIAADTSGNGSISSNDAALIARFVAGLGAPIGNTNQWRFFVPNPTFPIGSSPTIRTYTDPIGNPTGEDYVGILIGEVSGNWSPSAARQDEKGRETGDPRQETRGSGGPERGVAVELREVTAEVGKEIVVPVKVEGVADKSVISYEFDLRYDPLLMQPVADVVDLKDTASRGLSVVTNTTEPGLLRVVVYGAFPIDQDGVLLNLRFNAVGAAGSVSPISFERMVFNEGEPRVTVADGKIELF